MAVTLCLSLTRRALKYEDCRCRSRLHRHKASQNLVELGHDVYATDINKERLCAISTFTKGTFPSLHEALKIKPDIAFICTFSNDHIIPSIECAKAGCHLFIEKPLSLNLDGIDNLIKIVNERNLITMTGCNMRFHPAISYIHDTLNNNPDFGKRLWAKPRIWVLSSVR